MREMDKEVNESHIHVHYFVIKSELPYNSMMKDTEGPNHCFLMAEILTSQEFCCSEQSTVLFLYH